MNRVTTRILKSSETPIEARLLLAGSLIESLDEVWMKMSKQRGRQISGVSRLIKESGKRFLVSTRRRSFPVDAPEPVAFRRGLLEAQAAYDCSRSKPAAANAFINELTRRSNR